MKQKFIVYYSYVKLGNTTVKAFSPAEAKYIVKKRLKGSRLLEPKIDKVMSEAEETAIMENRDNPTTW